MMISRQGPDRDPAQAASKELPMPLADMTLPDLEQYRPTLERPVDLRDFWKETLAAAQQEPIAVTAEPVATHLMTLDHYDVTFSGYGGARIKAWLSRPAGVTEDLPVVVEYQGYGGGRGLPVERLTWASAGYAHLFVDTRGQGGTWGGGGHTPDPEGSDSASPGFMTRGIMDRDTYYYRRVYVDAVRAVEAARGLPGVRPGDVAVAGASQGGGIALAVASLVPDLKAVLADVPFLSHFRRALDITGEDPYQEITRYLSTHRDRVDQVFRTLSYFDVAHLVETANAPALFSVALMDAICPPSTVYAAYHSYGGPAEIEVYPYNGHEGGQMHHWTRQLPWLARHLSPATR
jgi:cephalosporin-C deacetylase